MAQQAGTVLDAGGTLPSWDVFARAIGVLQGKNVPGPYAIVTHPWASTGLGLIKEAVNWQTALPRPEGIPAPLTSNQIGLTGGNTIALVYSPSQVVLVRRQNVTVE